MNGLPLQSALFVFSDETLRAMIRDAEKLIHDAPVTAEEVRYHVQQALDSRT